MCYAIVYVHLSTWNLRWRIIWRSHENMLLSQPHSSGFGLFCLHFFLFCFCHNFYEENWQNAVFESTRKGGKRIEFATLDNFFFFRNIGVPSSILSFFAFFFVSFLYTHTHAGIHTQWFFSVCKLHNTCAEFRYVHAILCYFYVYLLVRFFFIKFSMAIIFLIVLVRPHNESAPIGRRSFCGNNAKDAQRTFTTHRAQTHTRTHSLTIGDEDRKSEWTEAEGMTEWEGF